MTLEHDMDGARLVPMQMMRIRHVSMSVTSRSMLMRVAMGAYRHGLVPMIVMLVIVRVRMLVLQSLVGVQMFV